jgi:hypothetical protein
MRELDRITQKYGLQKIKEHLNVQQ